MEEQTYKKLANFGKALLDCAKLEEGLPLIAKYTTDIIGAKRCSIFIYDSHKDILWTTIADGMEKIIVGSQDGIVGQSLMRKQIIIENNAHSNPNFLAEVDEESGFSTKNLICAPILSSADEVIGVLELLNKTDGFAVEDEKFMKLFSTFISGFIELAPLK